MTRRLVWRAVVSLGVLAALLLLLPWSGLSAAWARLSWPVWLGAVGGFAAGHALGVVKWRMLVNAGRAALTAGDAAAFYGAALFANLCLPGVVGGDLLRASLAARRTGRTAAAVLGGLMDRALDLAATAVLVLAGSLAARGAVEPWVARLLELLVAGAVVGIVVLLVAARRPLAAWPRRLRRPVGRGLVALRHLTRSGTVAVAAIAISLVIQSGFVLVNAEIGRAVGIDVPLAVWFVAWPLAKLVGLLPISLGGLAVRDATLAALLAPAGVPLALGVAAGLVWQTVMLAGGALGALVWWWHGGRSLHRAALPLRSLGRPVAR